jgi:acyl-CoA synthetase (AMP-forming)/AMP-acid ligase II
VDCVINLSSFIGFHARRTPDRCAVKYGGMDISYAEFDRRIGKVAGRVFSAMPWRFVDYWAMTHEADLGRYHLTEA